MKKILFLIPLFLLLFLPLIQAGSDCTPDTGFDWCYTNTYEGATAVVQGTNAQGHFYTNSSSGQSYAVPLINQTDVFYNVDYMGTRLYAYNPISSFNNVECDENGCDGEQISRGKYSVGSIGNDYNKCLAFVSWKKKTHSDGSWEMSWVGYGWLTCGTRHIVACYNDGNCPANSYCDKNSSDWKQWSCKTKTVPQICTNGDKQNISCSCGKSYTSANCVNGQWVPIQFYVDPCISLCQTQNCTSSQPSNTCGTDNCGKTYDKCNTNYTCSNNQCVQGGTTDTWAQIKNIATTPLFKISTFQVVLWHLLVLLLLLGLILRR
jgi:hypothetical protein